MEKKNSVATVIPKLYIYLLRLSLKLSSIKRQNITFGMPTYCIPYQPPATVARILNWRNINVKKIISAYEFVSNKLRVNLVRCLTPYNPRSVNAVCPPRQKENSKSRAKYRTIVRRNYSGNDSILADSFAIVK